MMSSVKHRLLRRLAPAIPVKAEQVELSAIASAADEAAQPSERLLDVALRAADRARTVSMSRVVERMTVPPFYPDVWPGEHYKLLAGLVAVCEPRVVVEIGTATGLSALAMRDYLPAGGRQVTLDVIPWREFPDTCLRADDFIAGRFDQVIGDVSDPAVMRQHAALFEDADLIFADGPKDGVFEQLLLDRLAELKLGRAPLVVFDDVRVWNMLAIWRGIRRPKLDLTSFGHWSGTGLVDWLES